jgi:hypothetical protein
MQTEEVTDRRFPTKIDSVDEILLPKLPERDEEIFEPKTAVIDVERVEPPNTADPDVEQTSGP